MLNVCELFCVLSVCELFGETISNIFGCVCYFVVECDGVIKLSVVGGALLDRPCMVFEECVCCTCGPNEHLDALSISMVFEECVCCTCGPNEHLDALSISFFCVFVCRKLSPHLGV